MSVYREQAFADDPERDWSEHVEQHILRVAAYRFTKHRTRIRVAHISQYEFWDLARRLADRREVAQIHCHKCSELIRTDDIGFGEIRLATVVGPVSVLIGAAHGDEGVRFE